jgi:hypothetical protein
MQGWLADRRQADTRRTRTLTLTYQRIWVIGARPTGLVGSSLFKQESALLHSDFSLAASRHFCGIIVTLWIRR